MRRALFEFYVPVGKLPRVAGVSAVLTLLLFGAGVYAPLVPWLACGLAYLVCKCFGELFAPPLREWQQALPVPATLLSSTRVLAPWCLGWSGVVASLAMSSALTLAGALTHEQWLGALSQTLCLLGLLPLASVALRFEPEWAAAAGGASLLISGALLFPLLPWLLDAAAGAAIGMLIGSGFLIVAFALALTDFNELSGPLQHAPFVAPRPALGARPMARPRHLVVQRFFYFGRPGWLLLTLTYAPLFLMFTDSLSLAFWATLSANAVTTLLGITQPPALPAHLPVSRTRSCLLAFAPLCFLALCGIAVERHAGTGAPLRVVATPLARGAAARDAESQHRRVLVPSLFWRATLTEPAPVSLANGELRRVPTQRVFSGLPLWVYNPFDAWQTEQPTVFNARVSQWLRDEGHLEVTDADVEDAYARRYKAEGLGRKACERQSIAGACEWPWMWLAVKLWLLALATWVMTRPQIRAQASDRRRKYRGLALLFMSLALVVTVQLAMRGLQRYEPSSSPWGFFSGSILLAELVRLCQRAPLLACSIGLSVLVALYWNLVRTYQRMELSSGPVP